MHPLSSMDHSSAIECRLHPGTKLVEAGSETMIQIGNICAVAAQEPLSLPDARLGQHVHHPRRARPSARQHRKVTNRLATRAAILNALHMRHLKALLHLG